MIGFFDSGFGWLKTMKYFQELYPEYDYLFFADNKNCPFWKKTWEEIQKITFDALNYFFDNGAKIVIIACNTAAAYSIRKRQTQYPDKKVLSITVPGIEEIIARKSQITSIWVLATKATITSDIYNDLYTRFWWTHNPDFHFVMASDLVDLVESGTKNETLIKATIKDYLSQLPKEVSTLVLWCTHFSVYIKYFQELFDGDIIDPSYYSAHKFGEYLQNHPELKSKLSTNWSIKFQTTWDIDTFDQIWSIIWWKDIKANNKS